MKCIGGSARGLYDVDIMRCKNSGSDYDSENVQWTCTASLPEDFKLGSTDVICEGYDSPDDPYILKGSCGVEYRLILTERGEEKYGKKKHWFGDGDDDGREDYQKTMGDRAVAAVFWLVFIGVALWIVFNAVKGWAERRNFAGGPGAGNRPGWGGGGGGGWGGGYDDDPPPPYNPHPDPSYKRNYGGTEGWRPGFWSGALGGAAAGYAARNWSGNNNQRNQTGTGWGSSSSSRWNNGEGSSRSSSGSSGSQSYSSTRHESTGFGSTSRR
jgi:hypothetical protein